MFPPANDAVLSRRRDNMVAHRAYWPDLREPLIGRTNLLYFAAAVPTVGFVHGGADLNPLDAAALERYAETRFIKRAQPTSRRWPSGPAVACLRWWG
jgi:hypothetical protein